MLAKEGGARGVGYRPELAAELIAARSSIDFLEVVAESCAANRRTLREVQAYAEMWPIVPHGVKLSLGSAEGIDSGRLERLCEVARAVRAPVVTEHVALTSAGGREIGHLTPIPRMSEAVRVVARNVAKARAKLPDVPLLLENIAVPFALPGDDMSEADFYSEIVARTGCDLLLDVANLYANAVNANVDPLTVARAFPLERVGMIHIAGGILEDGFYFDTHAHAVPEAVLEVLGAVLQRAPDVPIVLERDGEFDVGLSALIAEVDEAHARRPRAGRTKAYHPGATVTNPPNDAFPGSLAEDQAQLARLLTSGEAPEGAFAARIGKEHLDRARTILKRKRVDDALPLLPTLSMRQDLRSFAEQVLQGRGRSAAKQAVADAFAIANEASANPQLSDEAVRDLLALSARFVFGGAAPKARRAPFIAQRKLRSGAVLWAVKSFGESADVRVYERAAKGTNSP